MFENGPSISVYIPCRNYGRYLSQAVRSVQKQLYPNWELFIIDEASEDETVAIADSFSKEDPERIHVVRHDAPLGLQRSANEVLKYARGRYIIRLDADDWLDESALLLMVAKLESDSGLGIVYGNYYYTDEQGAVI
ncbi:MAG TPA: glycosyltransferase family 2 protein, partial [Alphaproteobacteria bacterium]|nr:glycosyltransferase family 2 protein [Alphaproteobacteria bacterium]